MQGKIKINGEVVGNVEIYEDGSADFADNGVVAVTVLSRAANIEGVSGAVSEFFAKTVANTKADQGNDDESVGATRAEEERLQNELMGNVSFNPWSGQNGLRRVYVNNLAGSRRAKIWIEKLDKADSFGSDFSIKISADNFNRSEKGNLANDAEKALSFKAGKRLNSFEEVWALAGGVVNVADPNTLASRDDGQKHLDKSYLQSVIDGKEDMLDPEFADKLEAVYNRNQGDQEIATQFELALNVYQEVMLKKAQEVA